jgi:hypothetical protein
MNRYAKDDTNLYWIAAFGHKAPPLAAVPTTLHALDRSRWLGSFGGHWRQDRNYNYSIEELNLVGAT